MHLKITSITLLFILNIVSSSFAISDISLTQKEKNSLSKDEIITREIPANGEGKTFEAIGLIKATRGDVYRILTDFEQYVKFMPNVSEVKVLKKTSDSAVLNYTLGLPLGNIKRYRLEMRFQENSPTANLQWKMVDWQGIKPEESIIDTSGYWIIRDYPEKDGYTIALYHVYTDPGPVPFGLGWIVNILTEKSVPDVVNNTRERAYRINED